MFPIICIILAIGVLFIWSASSEKFLFKQLVWIAMGLTLFFILLYFDYLSFSYYAYIIYACVLFLLILVLGMGGAVKGSQRWFSIGSFSVQPSEFMKITLVLTLARFLRYKKYGSDFFPLYAGGIDLFARESLIGERVEDGLKVLAAVHDRALGHPRFSALVIGDAHLAVGRALLHEVDGSPESQAVFQDGDLERAVVVGVGGEALSGDMGYGIDDVFLTRVALEVKEVRDLGCDVALVLGGGFTRPAMAS